MVTRFGIVESDVVVGLILSAWLAILLGFDRERRNTWLGFDIWDFNAEFCNIKQGSDKICVDSSYIGCQFAIGGSECDNGLTIVCSVSGKFGNGVDHILLVYGIGGLVSVTRRCDFGLTKLVMTEGKVALKMFPRFVSLGMVFPDFSVVE